ncbi:hypothetical protein V2J09_001941, partial [Rumex salicifolius]
STLLLSLQNVQNFNYPFIIPSPLRKRLSFNSTVQPRFREIPHQWGFLDSTYPKVVTNAIQEPTTDASSPNPNEIEFDNLYDMNGIIHPCFHPDDLDDVHPTSFEEVFTSVFEYVDRLFNITVWLLELNFLGLKGVDIVEEKEDKLRKQYAREGKKLLPKAKETQVDDPNNIAAGTEFMYELSKELQGYIQTRLKENPAWKNLKVILSDVNIPGEGEHKIVCFMRSQRSQPGYDVNARHCIHGLDADLIMLALATHELHISILREDKDVDSPKSSVSCKPIRKSSSYEFVQIWILKEYIELEMQASDAPEGFNLMLNEQSTISYSYVFLWETISYRAYQVWMSTRSLGFAHDNLSLETLEKFVLFLGSYEDQILQKRTKLSKSKMIRRVVNQPLASVSTQSKFSFTLIRDQLRHIEPLSDAAELADKKETVDDLSVGICTRTQLNFSKLAHEKTLFQFYCPTHIQRNLSSMGILGFHSWLVKKYPKVVTNAIQEPTTDASSPNPNGFEFDNLYLDMNGIIHPCFHPDDLDDVHPTSFKEVFTSVFEYVDRLFNIIRPRKLLYLAIDGVAPRAKFSRIKGGRYRCVSDIEISEEKENKLRKQYAREGKKLLPKAKETEVDDPNNIAPGTEFMYELSKALQGYIQTRLKENPAWKNLKVILSDANVPGEGEHKIVCFMRSQRNQPGYDVNTRHCIHGLDADLIMLALATHELHISILREDRDFDSSKSSLSCKPIRKSSSYEFVQIWILKEYIELEMQASDAPEGFKFDVERAVDDFILICFLVGNDFIPRLPSLDVREGALDLLMTVYKKEFKTLGGYLVDSAQIHEPNGAYLSLERLEKFVLFLGSYEDQILQKRTRLLKRKMSRRVENQPLASRNDGARDMETHIAITNADNDDIIKNTRQLKEELRKQLQDEEETVLSPRANEIKYGSAGWKDRYYDENFPDDDELELDIIKDVSIQKVYVGFYSTIFLEYHLGLDFKGIAQKRVEFEEGVPLKPFDMLKTVLPPRSLGLLPRPFRKIKFYARMSREYAAFMNDGIDNLVPFYCHERAVRELTEYEAQRNSLNTDALFVRALSDFGSQLESNKVDDSSSAVNEVGGFVDLILHALDSSNEEDRILVPNQKICSGTQENEASGSSGLLSSREGLYNHPNLRAGSQTTRSSNSSVSFTPQAQAWRVGQLESEMGFGRA